MCGFPRQLTDDERVVVEEAVAAVEAVKQAAAADEGGVWEWQGDYGGGWRAFKAKVAAELEKKYQEEQKLVEERIQKKIKRSSRRETSPKMSEPSGWRR